jgi:hypothetical protein
MALIAKTEKVLRLALLALLVLVMVTKPSLAVCLLNV